MTTTYKVLTGALHKWFPLFLWAEHLLGLTYIEVVSWGKALRMQTK